MILIPKQWWAAVACAAVAISAVAADFPTKPLTVIVPFPPGGSSDATMRAMSGKLTERLRQPVVIENKPGANGTIGAGMVARAPADGHTFLIGSVGTYAITPNLLKNLTYDTLKDLEPLTLAVRTPNVIVVTPSLPVNTLPELVAYMKKNPGKVSFASAGIGSTDHLSSVLLWQQTKTEGVHVPYKGGGVAIADVMAGHADVIITNLGVLVGHISSGKLKPLAVTSSKRVPELPQVATVAESGFKELEVYSWQGIAAPKGLPPEVSRKLAEALVESLNDPTVRKTLETAGFEVVASSASEFGDTLKRETARWKTVIDTAGIKAE
jgi:tripartite-type tricarboxylate transporter receptor subunit TctC